MCKNLSPTKTRRGNCLVLPHTGYALAVYNNVKFSRSYDVKSPWDTGVIIVSGFIVTDGGLLPIPVLLSHWLQCAGLWLTPANNYAASCTEVGYQPTAVMCMRDLLKDDSQ